jgi:peptide/nickel transport system permease protein
VTVVQRYLIKRALRALLVIWLVATLVFFALRTIGDPVEFLLFETAGTEEAAEELRRFLGIDKPMYEQYGIFLWKTVQGDLGTSFANRRSNLSLILNRLGATFQVGGAALVLGLAMGLPVGILAATKPNSVVDRASILGTAVAQATPIFWLAIMMIMLFAVRLDWLPATGRGGIKELIMPAFALAVPTAASVARLLRASMIEVMSEDFILTAHAKGLGPIVVPVRHVVRNALLPVITVLGLEIGTLIAGSVLIEAIFVWPGLGLLMIQAIEGRNFSLVQAIVLAFAVSVVIGNFLADIAYAYVDPRIRYA